MGVGERLLEVGEIGTAALDQAVHVDQPAALPGLVHREAVLRHGQADQLGDAGARRAGAEEQEGLVFPTVLEDAEGGRDAGHGHGRGALDVVVVAADPVAVAGQERHGMEIREVLELDATAREDFLHGRHELFEEGVVFVPPHARLTQPEVERIGQQRFVVGADIESDRQRDLGGTPAQAV